MPNWCYTDIHINYDDEQKLKAFSEQIERWMKTPALPDVTWSNWLGNIILNAEIGTVDTGKSTDLRCRGDVTYLEFMSDYICIDTETAWVPMMQLWQKLVDKYLPDAEITYCAEECGCELYWTNDPLYAGEDRIDSGGEDAEPVGYIYDDYSSEETLNLLQEWLKTDSDDIESLIAEANDEFCVSINPWECVEICDCD